MYSVAFFVYVLLCRLVILSPLERKFIAHPFDFRSVIPADLLTMFIFAFLISPAAIYACNHIAIKAPVPRDIDRLPMFARILLYFVVADFGHYWIHRLMHAPFSGAFTSGIIRQHT